MKWATIWSLTALLAAPPPPPPADEVALPGVELAEDGLSTGDEAGAPAADVPAVDADEDQGEDGDRGEPLDPAGPVDAAELEPASRPDGDPGLAEAEADAPPPASQATGPRPPTGDEPLDLDPYGRSKAAKSTAPGRNLQIAGLVVNGVGVAAGVGALVFLIRGMGARNDLDEALEADDRPARVDAIESIEANDRNAIILGASAGALIVVGTSLYFLGRKQRADAYARTHVAPGLVRGGAGLVVGGQF